MKETNKNKSVVVDGKIEWISRSIVVACVVLAYDKDGDLYILLNQRGSGVSGEGKWSSCGGYLDYNETLEEAAKREVFEETGVDIYKYNIELIDIYSMPYGCKQNIVMTYGVVLDEKVEDVKVTNEYAEENEINDIKFVKISDLDEYKGKLIYNHAYYINKTIQHFKK